MSILFHANPGKCDSTTNIRNALFRTHTKFPNKVKTLEISPVGLSWRLLTSEGEYIIKWIWAFFKFSSSSGFHARTPKSYNIHPIMWLVLVLWVTRVKLKKLIEASPFLFYFFFFEQLCGKPWYHGEIFTLYTVIWWCFTLKVRRFV